MIQPASNDGTAARIGMGRMSRTRRFALVLAFVLGLVTMAGTTSAAHAGTWKCDYRDDNIGPYHWGISGAHQMVGEVAGGRASYLSLPREMTAKYRIDLPFGRSVTLPMSETWSLDNKRIKQSGSKFLFDFGYKVRISDPVDEVLDKVLGKLDGVPGVKQAGVFKYASRFKSVVGVAKTLWEELSTVDFHMWASRSSAGATSYQGAIAFRCL